MKQKLLKLFILFVTMSVLTSSSKDSGTSAGNQSAINGHKCPEAKNDYALNMSCKETVVAPGKSEDARIASLADNEISLSPISRFILVQ